jgi:outer membrane protein assembly factor BamB
MCILAGAASACRERDRPQPPAAEKAGVSAPAAPNRAANTVATARRGISSAVLAGPALAWSFRSASPVSAPVALAPGGGVVVTTNEGCVHRLGGDDGQLEWSYTLAGSPLGAASVDGEGRVYVTTRERVYALDRSGRKRWVFESLVSAATPVLWSPRGVVYFVGRDKRLYALSATSGALLWHRPLAQRASTELALAPNHDVALATQAPELWLIRDALRAERVSLPGELSQAPLFSGTRWLAQGSDELLAFDVGSAHVAWRSSGQRAGVNSAGSLLVQERSGSLLWLEADSGRTLHELALPLAGSAPPALTDSGIALVPTASGILLVLQAEPADVVPVRVSWAPLLTPVYDPVSRRALVSGGDGLITAVDIGQWLDRRRDGA